MKKRASCKICGKPRWTQSDLALCEDHHLAYYRRSNARKRQRAKQAQMQPPLCSPVSLALEGVS